MNKRKKIAIITGGNSGIGLDAGTYLASKGFKVYSSARKKDKLRLIRAESEKNSLSEQIEPFLLDVNNKKDINSAFDYILKKEKIRDAPKDFFIALINNAGYGISSPVEETSLEEYRAMLETNTFGPIATSKKLIPILRESGAGRIVQLSSGFGRIGSPLMSAYNTSKFALEGFSESLRYELLPYNVFVSLIEPGPVKTMFNENMKNPPAKKESPYSALIEKANKLAKNQSLMPVSKARDVTLAIYKAVNDSNPSLRY
ncbi:MAG: SDR family oxidoreductase, partial [Leptospira sp.]|nr:SDR family oxidoreductase [Leptospira sp.]